MDRFLVCLALPLLLIASAAEPPPLYAFQNGVHFATPAERVAVLKELGYDGIGSAKLKAGEDVAARVKAYEDAGLRLFSFYMGGRLGEDGHRYTPGLKEAIPRLEGSGVVLELFVQGSPKTHTDEQAVAYVREIAEIAAASGLKVVLYPHSGFYIDTLGDAVRVARLCERDNVGVMFNLCHYLKVEPDSDLRAELRKAKPWLWQVSLNGADSGGNSWGQLIQTLDRGTVDQTEVLAALREVGFDGPVGLQCYAIKGNARENLARSIAAWNKLHPDE